METGALSLPKRSRLALVLVCMLTVLAFAPALRGPQLFDDPAVLDENQSITRLWPLSIPLHPPTQSPVAGRPIANLSLAVDHAVNRALGVDQRPDPAGSSKTVVYHVTNLLLHLITGLLLFGVIRRTLLVGRFTTRYAGDADAFAFLVSAVWLLHPIQSEAVNYLSQRSELLVSLCYLGTLYASIRAWCAEQPSARNIWYTIGVMSCLLGMGSKEVMVTAPIVVLLYGRVFLFASWRELFGPELRSRRWFHAASLATLLLLFALVAGAPRSTSAGFHAGLDWQRYLVSQGWAIPHYLRLMLWPVGFAFDYGMEPIALSRALPGLLLLAALAAATIFAWTRINRWGWAAFCGTWFFFLLAPSSSVIPIATEIAAERRVYLASAGVLVACFVALDALMRRFLPATARRVLAPGLLVVLALMTAQRSRLYQSPEAIWRDALARVPNNPRAMTNLGVVLVNAPTPMRGEADSLFRRAVALDSDYVTAWYNIAAIASAEHRSNDEAVALHRVLDLRPGDARSLVALGQLAMAAGQADSAEDFFRRAMLNDSTRVDALYLLGAMMIEQGHPERSLPFLERAVRVDSTSGMSHALLGLADAELGDPAAAISHAQRAILLTGEDGRVDFFAGRALAVAGRPDLAAPPLRRMVQLGYQNPDALALLAAVEARLKAPPRKEQSPH